MEMDLSSKDERQEPPPPYSPYPTYTVSHIYNATGLPTPGPHPTQPHPEAPPDYTQNQPDTFQLSDAVIRRGFLRKVYVTLMLQLSVTTGIICAFVYWETLNVWTRRSSWFTYTMLAVVFLFIIILSCCGDLRRKVPLNFFFLALFTAAEGLMLGSVTVFFRADSVMWAVGSTVLVSFGLSLFALQTKMDFTARNGCFLALSWTVVSVIIMCSVLQSRYLYVTYAGLGTLIFSWYIVMDTQWMLSGKHKYSISPEEYIFATLNLYLDVTTLFLCLVQLISR